MTAVLLDGLAFGESARWHDDRLWFADWGTREIVTLDTDGRRDVVAHAPTSPFSIDWLPDGQLVVTGDTVYRLDGDGFVPLSDLSALSPGWNELVVDGRGNAFVNAAGFDLMAGAEPTSGTVAVLRPDGSSATVADDVWFPNGMAVTPDDATLVVAESYRSRLTAFTITASAELTERRVFAALGTGVPDGICLDAEGAVWYADVPNKRCVRVREGGEVLQTVDVDRGCFSCMLGGPAGTTLYIVARQWGGTAGGFGGERTGQILGVEVDVPHAGRP
jgi:sugar lactone lactonase YvrE